MAEEVKTVKIFIDDVEHNVPAGANLVDAAKMTGTDIPVFCYHPKLGHDGNCRMCLVELATPRANRETGEMELAWFPTLQTACTQRVSEGIAIRTKTQKVVDGRREILEFLLSSHPLDCPICDKGGECPLQNLTMRHGPGTSRMYWNDKMRLGKHIPLGDQIYLDRERCIHCARCIRFQDLIAGEPVLGFDSRGRHQMIVTYSEPGFDSPFSGNTTDICPVGALTTADFHFNARPWEMIPVASLDTHFPSGDNIVFDTRTDRMAGGRTTIKRVMPRQNEEVNEIWISDKTRFGRHYMEHPDRLTAPMVRKSGKLVEVSWDEALTEVASLFRQAGADVAAIGGPRLSNEDFYSIQKLIRSRGSSSLTPYPAHMAGAEQADRAGVASGTNLQTLGKGDAILVIASDLYAEAPVWWLRVKAAARRGATLIVANGRETRLDKYATYSVRTVYGDEAVVLNGPQSTPAGKAFAEAANAVVFVGGEGLTSTGSAELAEAAANLLITTGHTGKVNNGLIMVWPGANLQGAFDMGFSHAFGPGYAPVEQAGLDYASILSALESNELKLAYIAGADPVFDDYRAEEILRETKAAIVVQDMFLTETARLADVVLPTQSIAERDGTYTSGERRVQRFFPAIEPIGQSKADWEIAALVLERLSGEKAKIAATLIFLEIARAVPQYRGMTYQTLSRVVEQQPNVGGEDLYYGGTTYTNEVGIGQQWAVHAESEPAQASKPAARSAALKPGKGEFVVVPVTVIYDREPVFEKSTMVHSRVPAPYAALNPTDAQALGVAAGDLLSIPVNGHDAQVEAVLDAGIPQGVVVVPRRLQAQGAPVAAAVAAITRLEKVQA